MKPLGSLRASSIRRDPNSRKLLEMRIWKCGPPLSASWMMPGVERWYLSPEGSERKESWTKYDGCGLRVWGQLDWYSGEKGPPVPRLLVRVHLPPDSHPISWGIEDLEVTDGSGQTIKIEQGT